MADVQEGQTLEGRWQSSRLDAKALESSSRGASVTLRSHGPAPNVLVTTPQKPLPANANGSQESSSVALPNKGSGHRRSSPILSRPGELEAKSAGSGDSFSRSIASTLHDLSAGRMKEYEMVQEMLLKRELAD